MNTNNPNTNNPNPNPTPNATGGAATATPPVITSKTDPSASKAKVSIEARYQTLVAGILANFEAVSTFSLPTGTFTRDELVATLQRRIAAAEDTKSTKTLWHTAVQAERQVEVDLRPLRKGLQQFVASRYGAGSARMADFGFTPAKPRKASVRTKATAADKAKATRKARGTMGKNQKKSIKGQPAATATPPPPATTAPPSPTGGAK